MPYLRIFVTKMLYLHFLVTKWQNAVFANISTVHSELCTCFEIPAPAVGLNMWSHRGIQQIIKSYRWARIYRFLRQEYHIYKCFRQNAVFTKTTQKCYIFTFLQQKLHFSNTLQNTQCLDLNLSVLDIPHICHFIYTGILCGCNILHPKRVICDKTELASKQRKYVKRFVKDDTLR